MEVAVVAGGGGNSGNSSGGSQVNLYQQAKNLIDDEQYAKAIPLLQKSIQQKGEYADALNLLGYSNRKLGDKAKAMTYYTKALNMEPNHLGANEYMGELYLEMNDLAQGRGTPRRPQERVRRLRRIRRPRGRDRGLQGRARTVLSDARKPPSHHQSPRRSVARAGIHSSTALAFAPWTPDHAASRLSGVTGERLGLSTSSALPAHIPVAHRSCGSASPLPWRGAAAGPRPARSPSCRRRA